MSRTFCHVLLLLLTYLIQIGAGEHVEEIVSKKYGDPEYYLVTTIPEGAESINVTELSHTKNFLAVKLSNGEYLFNGNWNIGSSGNYKGAGTNFVYIRRNIHNPESFYAGGPLNSSIDVMLIYHMQEPKVFYQYEFPGNSKTIPVITTDRASTKSTDLEVSSTTNFVSTISENIMMGDEIRSSTVLPRRRKRRKLMWKVLDTYTRCSKSCGGGFQTKRYICIRPRTQVQVSTKKCESLERPRVEPVPCNTEPCPPQWVAGQWSRCSVTCGNGTRTRELKCMQELNDTTQQVSSHNCPAEPKITIPLIEACYMPDCNIYMTSKPKQLARWEVGNWSPCSATCGNGTMTRAVTCTPRGRVCNYREKPASFSTCNMHNCDTRSLTTEVAEALTDASWLYSAWPEQCSAECGRGIISRRLYCEKFLTNETCNEDKAPVVNITCVSSTTCGQWFVGPWSHCSSSCDIGVSTREVVCVSRFLGSLKVVKQSNCAEMMPGTRKLCMGPPCNATWFTSDWSQCSRTCGGGTQKREVRCIGPDGSPINASERECEEEKRPVSKRNCNDIPCKRPRTDEVNEFESLDSENDVEPECRDTLQDCWIIRQGTRESKHKCQMEVYQKKCCKACRYYSFLNSNG